MTNDQIVQKLTHLQLKKELWKISPGAYKRAVTAIGNRQKYPRSLGMLANEATRSVMDIVRGYGKVDFVAVDKYTDVLILADRTLHTIKIDFSKEPIPASTDDRLRLVTAFAYHSNKEAYPIESIAITGVHVGARSTETIKLPTDIFLKGDK